jgi:hypothetical protein
MKPGRWQPAASLVRARPRREENQSRLNAACVPVSSLDVRCPQTHRSGILRQTRLPDQTTAPVSAKIPDAFPNVKSGEHSKPPVSGVGPTGRHYARERETGEREERGDWRAPLFQLPKNCYNSQKKTKLNFDCVIKFVSINPSKQDVT